MPVVLGKERAKYGSGVGTIICWPVELTTKNPNNEDNIRKLPAGYLKCDGTIYKAEDYPQLAEILGVGSSSKFARRDVTDAFIDSVDDDEFIVPDLGSKFLKPTTGGSAGLYINIVKNDQSGQERRRSGMGIESSSVAGTTVGNTTTIPVSYTGAFTVPSQEISLQGKPAWTKGSLGTGFSDLEAVDTAAIHSHMHFSQTNRLRLKTTNEGQNVQAQGIGSYYVASTLPIQQWMDNTRWDNSVTNDPGTNQPPCWAIASGATARAPSTAVESTFGFEVVYANYCYDLYGAAGLNTLRYNCLLNAPANFPLNTITHKPPPKFTSYGFGLGLCSNTESGDVTDGYTVPATYVTGGQGVPEDWKGVSLSDVVPLNSNQGSKSQTSYPQVNNIFTDINELIQTEDPTIHNHKILLDIGSHNYKIKTNGFLLSPDNLQTTLILQTDQVASLDQVTSPYIIMEYLIKY